MGSPLSRIWMGRPLSPKNFFLSVHAETRIHRRVEILDGDRTFLARYAEGVGTADDAPTAVLMPPEL